MKTFLISLAIFACAQAQIDWNKVVPRHQDPPMVYNRHFVRDPRVVGGDEVAPNSLPYQAALLVDVEQFKYFCGGSLISANYVLTAAHCVSGSSKIEIILGAHNVAAEEPTQQKFVSNEFLLPGDWNTLFMKSDIALVRLPNPAVLNEYVNVIKLPSRADVENDFQNFPVLASGWGKDFDTSASYSEVLRSVVAPVISNRDCFNYFYDRVYDTTLCISGEHGKSTCDGDSGGPLVYADKLVGVTSFGVSLGCEIGYPVAATRVTKFLDWIQENTDVVIN